MINFGFDYLGKIRTVNLYNKVKTSIKMEARSETDTNKCRLSNRAAVKDILQLLEQREKWKLAYISES